VPKKLLFFVSGARKDLKEFPREVQAEIGQALQKVQWGGVPVGAKPLKGFGGVSVMEITERHDTNTYRAVYTAKFAEVIYVLHCFQKKAKRGIATPREEMAIIEKRLKLAEALHRQWTQDKAGE
jgi:phage-related protein